MAAEEERIKVQVGKKQVEKQVLGGMEAIDFLADVFWLCVLVTSLCIQPLTPADHLSPVWIS